ncbi:MAG: PAS domain-containing protein [Acetobacteraceae bacterium]|nr:PAS domain-containing protein [Acetobacteraceae bacterium]
MGQWLAGWLEPSAFSPHGFCLLWEPGLLWLHAGSDLLIAAAYLSIPVALIHFIRRRRDVEFGFLVWLFAAFILLCGATHIVGIVTLWQPLYWLAGGVKLATGIVSVATAIILWPLIPRALAIPTPASLRAVNLRLEREAVERENLLDRLRAREAELQELTRTLEARVADRTRELQTAKRRFEVALAASGVTVFVQDRGLRYSWVSQDVLGRARDDFVGRTDDEVLDEPGRSVAIASKQGVLATGEAQRVEYPAHGRWFEVAMEPTRGPDGRTDGLIGGAVDITERRAQEARIRFLLNEVRHRVGNLLTVVQAVMRQTAAGAVSINDFCDRFEARVRALAGAQRLLTEAGTGRATLAELIRSQLGDYADRAGSQLEVEGPPVALDETGVLHIGMALHELATNAAKYGALSVPEGRVRIAWTLEPGVEEETLCRLTWRERGGPPVEPSERRGFGRTVTEMAVATALNGQVRMAFPPDGAEWELTFPLAPEPPPSALQL